MDVKIEKALERMQGASVDDMLADAAKEAKNPYTKKLTLHLSIPGKLSHMGRKRTRKCRICGCTNERACPGGCYWVERDLCSACGEFAPVAKKPEPKGSKR